MVGFYSNTGDIIHTVVVVKFVFFLPQHPMAHIGKFVLDSFKTAQFTTISEVRVRKG